MARKATRHLGGKFLSLLLNWLLRGLTIIGGVIALTQLGPIVRASWQQQPADAVVEDMRGMRRVSLARYRAGIDAATRAIEADPTAPRYLMRSNIFANAAADRSFQLDQATRTDWLRRARADAVTGLGGEPASGVDWLRVAIVQLTLEGATPIVTSLLFTSLELAPYLPETYGPRLRVILEDWPLLTDQQKELLRRYLVRTWERGDRRYFAYFSYSATDDLIIYWFLRDVPGAPKEFYDLLQRIRR